MIYYHHKQLNDILGYQTDEEECAQNVIIFFFGFALGAFSAKAFLHVP